MPSAYVVTFEHQGRSYNVWVWPEDGAAPDACEVNVGSNGAWSPIGLSGGTVEPVEVQT